MYDGVSFLKYILVKCISISTLPGGIPAKLEAAWCINQRSNTCIHGPGIVISSKVATYATYAQANCSCKCKWQLVQTHLQDNQMPSISVRWKSSHCRSSSLLFRTEDPSIFPLFFWDFWGYPNLWRVMVPMLPIKETKKRAAAIQSWLVTRSSLHKGRPMDCSQR